MLRASGGYYLTEQTRYEKRSATNLAEAGLEYAFWQVHCKQAALPYSADVTLGNGSFHVEITDDGSRDRSSMLVTSRGACNGQSCTIKRVTLGPVPYQYCWCENVGADDGDILLTSGTGRGIRSNGKIKLGNAATSITNGGWANTVFEGNGTISPKNTYTPKIRFPAIDLSYYASIATRTYGSSASPVSVTINNAMLQGAGGVIFVYGDVWWAQNVSYTGNWTIIATDDIDVGTPIVAGNSNSYLALIAYDNIGLYTSGSSASDRIDAVLYAPNGQINIYGSHYGLSKDNDIYINGSMACDDFATSGDGGALSINMTYDSRLTHYVLRDKLKLPGL